MYDHIKALVEPLSGCALSWVPCALKPPACYGLYLHLELLSRAEGQKYVVGPFPKVSTHRV